MLKATLCIRCCSFGLQAACMLLSGTSVNHRAEAERSYFFIVGYTWVCMSIFYRFTFKIKQAVFGNVHTQQHHCGKQPNWKLPVVINSTGQRKFSRWNRIKLSASETFLGTFGCLEEQWILTIHVVVSGDLNDQSYTAVPCETAYPIQRDVIIFFCGSRIDTSIYV